MSKKQNKNRRKKKTVVEEKIIKKKKSFEHKTTFLGARDRIKVGDSVKITWYGTVKEMTVKTDSIDIDLIMDVETNVWNKV